MFSMVPYQTFKSTRKYPQKIKKTNKQYIEKLDTSGGTFPLSVKPNNTTVKKKTQQHYCKKKKPNNININVTQKSISSKNIIKIYI